MTEEEMQQALSEGLDAWDEHRRKQALKHMFKRKNLVGDFYYDFRKKPWAIAFYWLKALICILLKRTNGDYFNAHDICMWDQRPACGEYDGWDWECCWVEEGVFKNWRVCIMGDSSY
jgi:hypothetical protein